MKLNFGKLLFLLFFVILFGFLFVSNTFASVPEGTPCATKATCGAGMLCLNGECSTVIVGGEVWVVPTVQQVQDNISNSVKNPAGEGVAQWQTSVLPVTLGNLVTGGEITNADGEPTSYNGAFQNIAGMIGGMAANPPAKTVDYIADVAREAGFIDSAYAQGTGWVALDPVLDIWKAFRNISYFAFVIVFVVIGFMIMFRKKLGGQTVVTIQAAIPQIIITLILITFSYAIASLVIDMIYFLIYLLIGIFESFGLITTVADTKKMLLGESLFVNGWKMSFGNGAEAGQGAAESAASAVARMVSGMLDNKLGEALGWISSGLVYFIFAFAILIAIFKLFFKLLLAYISIIFSVIFAPILLLFNAVPGSQSFSKWLKGIFANALLFPVTAALILVSASLTGSESFGMNKNIGYSKPNAQSYTKIGLPFIMGGVNTGAIQALIAIGMLMMMPQILEMVQKAMGVEGGLAGAMQGITGGLGTGAKSAGFLPGRIGGAAKDIYMRERAAREQSRLWHGGSGKEGIDSLYGQGASVNPERATKGRLASGLRKIVGF